MTLIPVPLPPNDGPVLHALVIGCGRFPFIPAARKADRQACYDSAVAVVDFLLEHAGQFEPQLGSIDCLLSDPRVDPANAPDLFPARPDHGIAAAIAVDRPRAAQMQPCFDALLARCRTGDAILFYCCSHGVAERDETGLLVLEDANQSVGARWAELLNVKSVAQFLPTRSSAANVWIFMDACQEVLDDLRNQVGGAAGIEPVRASTQEMVSCSVRSVAISAARYGKETHAPKEGGVAYFTRALLDGLGQSCVERNDRRWRVSAMHLQYGLDRVARAAGHPPIETTSLVATNTPSYLLSIAEPSIPVLIRSRPSRLVDQATSAHVTDGNSGPLFAKTQGQPWRFRVPVAPANYEIKVVTPNRAIIDTLEVAPPAVVWEIRDGQ